MVPPKTLTADYYQAGRLLGTGPRVRIFNNRNNNLDSNSSNYSNNCKNMLLVFSFCSKLLLEFSYLSKCVFDFRLKTERMFDLLHLLAHKAGDLTRPGQRPGEFLKRGPDRELPTRNTDRQGPDWEATHSAKYAHVRAQEGPRAH